MVFSFFLLTNYEKNSTVAKCLGKSRSNDTNSFVRMCVCTRRRKMYKCVRSGVFCFLFSPLPVMINGFSTISNLWHTRLKWEKGGQFFFPSSSQTYIFGVRQGLTIRVGIRKKNQKIKFQEHNTLTFGGNFIYHTQIDDDIRHISKI
jgi:hypothetical protein